MNRRHLFSFLAAVPFGILAAVKGLRAEKNMTGFFKREGYLTAAERAEFKKVFIDPVLSKSELEWLAAFQEEMAALHPETAYWRDEAIRWRALV